MDTIFAVATPSGRGAIAVVRLSGDRSHEAVRRLCDGQPPAPRRLALRRLRWNGELLDEALVALFPEGSSFTGEESAELHLHGGVAVATAVMGALDAIGLRRARPGEFSRRALAAGKADLAQLEGMADLVAAETDAQRRQALRLLDGGLSGRVAAWRSALVEAWALVEASIDFSDEELPEGVGGAAQAALRALAAEFEGALKGVASARAIRDGVEIAIIGAPNAGKSTLINRIAGREVALTAEAPGTTRDVLEARIVLAGVPVTLLDTAGLRDATEAVEAAGVALGRRRAAAADLRVLVTAPDAPPPADGALADLVVWNKADIVGGEGLNVSALTGQGIDDLLQELSRRVGVMTAEAGVLSQARHSQAVRRAAEHVRRASAAPAEIAAEELRAAASALDSIVGRVDAETLLDDIFARFCIGK